MSGRLVLGCSRLGQQVVEALVDGPGTLRVLDPDPSRVERLREASVPADLVDVTDAAAIRGREPVGVVLVIGADPEQNLAAVGAARTAYPDVPVVAYTGREPTPDQRRSLRERADRTLEAGGALCRYFEERTADGALERARGLREALAGIDGRLGVFTHDNPDPDAIASGVALAAIADRLGVEAEVCYYGEISHQENRAMVNLLDLSLQRLAAGERPAHDALALVDHARPGVNDGLPPDAEIAVVIDHHPPGDEDPTATYVDRRSAVGATSTLLAEYARSFDVNVAGPVATGLVYGIRVDTDDFRREVAPADVAAVADLLPHADRDILRRIERPSVAGDTLDTMARAARARYRAGETVVAVVGEIADRDALAQAAEWLLDVEGVRIVVVAGATEGTVYLSARARGADVDLGAVLRRGFGAIGSAGGHADMAGAQLPMTSFEADDELDRHVERAVIARTLAALADEKPAATPLVPPAHDPAD